MSVYLFLIVGQIFCRYLKSSSIKGITIADKEILVSQLAEDTALFLKDSVQVPQVLQIINIFSNASGLFLNLKKCELFSLKECDLSSIDNIAIKNEVTYLGIKINKNQKHREDNNFNPMIKKAENKFSRWLQRHLSLKGRCLLTKAEGLSRLVYIASSLSLDNKNAKKNYQLLLNFLWKNQIHDVKKSVVINSLKNGGLDFLDFSTLNNVLKIKWLQNFLRDDSSMWNFIPKFMFDKVGGLPFLLLCNFKISKLPLKLSNFHKQVLLAWTLIYKHNFSPQRYCIWNNSDILHRNKSLFLKSWVEKDIVLVKQLLTPEGIPMSHHDFCFIYNMPVSPAEYDMVLKAIPSGVKMLCNGSSYQDTWSFPKLNDTNMLFIIPEK